MPDHQSVEKVLGVIVVAAPALLVAFLGLTSLLKLRLREATINLAVQAAIFSGLLAALVILALMLVLGSRHVPVEVGEWVHVPRYHYNIKFLFDRLSVPMAILSFLLTGTIGAFASRYMHREPGYNRFFVLYAVFVLGMVMTSLAGTIETLFAGWELVGLSSALLVTFFQDRVAPARNGLWVWSVYRVSDAALLLAAVVMHHMAGVGDFDRLLGSGPWPEGHALVTSSQALIVGSLLLVAAAGKSALVPFSGWLPRAMEGPTPSSAVFYGALSVHLGAFLLLRVSPLLDASPILAWAVVALGLATALVAYLSASVQTDIKSALSYASLLQVGLIVAEIGIGLRYIALVHLLGHACLRTLQFVRAPTLLQDYRSLENALGRRLPNVRMAWQNFGGRGLRGWMYRLGLERGYLDSWIKDYVVTPFLALLHACDGLERRWVALLSRDAERESDRVRPYPGRFEELT